MSSSSSPSPSVVERVSDFVSENKRAVLIGAAITVAAIGGAAYYASTSSRRPGDDVEKSDKKEKGKERKKDKAGAKKKKTTKDKDGPILEERKPKVEEVEAEVPPPTAEQIAAMSEEDRKTLAGELKAKGNAAYSKKNFIKAAELYTQAIEVSPSAEPVYYSNRAACYVNFDPPEYTRVVEDCDEALKLDKKYIKALNRRAVALEHLDRNFDALKDFTAATILEKFANESTAQAVERVLKKLAMARATEILKEREPRLPSHTFISAYFGAFRPRALPVLPENPTTGDNTFLLARQALDAGDYIHALTLINESLDQGISFDSGKAEALNLRGTFKFLMSDVMGAKADLEESIDIMPSLSQTWVKIASVHMEQGDPKKAFECFEEAIKHNSSDADIFYHRGQVLFIMNEFTQAADDYGKSTSLDDKFVFSHIQLAVAQYKMGNIANSMATFRRTLKAFPDRSEPQNYYGELLLDQQRFQEAVEKFDRAMELEGNKSGPKNALPLVNKGLALYQWKQDFAAAEKCCSEALAIDPECEAAIASLAQLCLQQSKIEEASQYFEQQAELARSEAELMSALNYLYATKAQKSFIDSYPEMQSQLNSIARQMM